MKYYKITLGILLFTLGIAMMIYDFHFSGWKWYEYICMIINSFVFTSWGIELLHKNTKEL